MKEICTGNCAKCPVVLQRAGAIDQGRNMLEKIAKKAMTDSVENDLLDPIFESIERIPGAALGYVGQDGEIKIAESVDEIASVFRSNTGNTIDGLEIEIDKDQTDLERMVSDCDGPLSMRAIRDGVEVIVRVCMNSDAPEGQAPGEPATIFRRFVDNQ